MKHFSSLLFTSLICSILLFFASCNPDEETPAPGTPSVTITGDGIEDNTFEGSPGETVSATIDVNAPGGFNTLIIRRYEDGTEITTDIERILRGSTVEESFTHNFTYTIENEDIDKEVYYTFEAVDEGNQSSSIERLDIVATVPPAARYTSVLLFAPLETDNSETFFSTNTGETYSMNDVNNSTDPVSANIDYGYFFGQEFGATLAAPSSYPLPEYGQANWTVRNNTRIGRTNLTAAQYTEITESNIQAINDAYAAATFAANPQQVRNLVVGEILAFETDATKTGGSKRGLIQVRNIVSGTGETGSIEIEVLVIQ